MQKKEICIGHVAKAHGLNGAFSIKLYTPNKIFEILLDIKSVYLGEDKLKLKVIKIEPNSNKFLRVITQQISNRESAKRILRKRIFLKIGEHSSIDEEFRKLQKYIGYTIIDQKTGLVGEIIEIDNNRPQPIFLVDTKKNELYVPNVDSLVTEVSDKEKKIFMNLPEGLTEICVR